jgi:hypothetical protein
VEEPVFAGFEAADDRVVCGLRMRCGVLARRVVAAPYVTALSAPAKMQPPASPGLAFNATGPAGWNRNVDSSYGVHVASPRIGVPLNPTLGDSPKEGIMG